jgi:hypothetical protein
MHMRIFSLAAIASMTLLAFGSGQASATVATTCGGEVTANGGTSLPGTNIGTIASGCEIGPFDSHEGQNGSNIPSVSVSLNPSIYEFTWGGGNLTIEEEIGNNGLGNNINVELGLAGSNSLISGGSLSSYIVSTVIAFSSGPTAPIDILDSYNLAAGTYVLDTYLGSCEQGNCSGVNDPTDPQYQVLFSPISATPLPAAMPLFATGLGFVGMLGWRRKRKARAIAA